MNPVDLIAACLQLEEALRLSGFAEEADQQMAIAQTVAEKAGSEGLTFPSGTMPLGREGAFAFSSGAPRFSGASGAPFASGASGASGGSAPFSSGASLGVRREEILSLPSDYEPQGPWTRGLQRAFDREARAEQEQRAFASGASGSSLFSSGVSGSASAFASGPSPHWAHGPGASGDPTASGVAGLEEEDDDTRPLRLGLEPSVSGQAEASRGSHEDEGGYFTRQAALLSSGSGRSPQALGSSGSPLVSGSSGAPRRRAHPFRRR